MQKLRVLVVDDSMEDVRLTAGHLRKAGHEVLVARNGEDGVRMACSERPDLILMDVVMPGLNGFQATRELSKNQVTKHIPIIMISGKDQETDKVWAMRQGARAYITKAVERKVLFDTIGDVIA